MAQWVDSIILIGEEKDGTNENGFPEKLKGTEIEVFCNKKSISTTEYYKSQQMGMKVECKVEVQEVDYNQEELVELDGKRYKVLKTYMPQDNNLVELTLASSGAE